MILSHICRTRAISGNGAGPAQIGARSQEMPSLRAVLMVPEEGVEPSRPEGHGILRPVKWVGGGDQKRSGRM